MSAIVDHTGRPFARRRADTQEIGFHGLSRSRGIITEEWVADLTGARRVRVYERMESDGMVTAMLLAMELPIIGAAWRVEPAGSDRNAVRAADLVERVLFERLAPCWEAVVEKLLAYLQFGFQVAVKEWALEGGEVVLSELRDVHPRAVLQGGKNWEFDPQGKLVAVHEYGTDGESFREERLPRERVIHLVRRGRWGNPEGRSILRGAYKHWVIIDLLHRLQAIGLERGAIGTPIGKYQPGASESEQNALREFVQNIAAHENGYGLFPVGVELQNFAVELRTEDIKLAIDHHYAKLAQSALAQFLMLGQEGSKGGAYALSADQTDLFLLCLEAVGHYLAAVINREVIPELVDYNIATDQYPLLSCTVARRSATEMANFVRGLTAGMNPVLTVDEGIEDHLRELVGLPPRTGPRPEPAARPAPDDESGEDPGPAAGDDAESDKPEKPGAMRRERIALPVLMADPVRFREEPAYPALGQVADEFAAALAEELAGLRADVWRIARLPEISDDAAATMAAAGRASLFAEIPTPALDRAIAEFIARLAGEDLTAEGFAGTASEDALIQGYLRLAHAVGAGETRRLTGAKSAAFQPTRESPQIKRLLTDSFTRLTMNSEGRLMPYLDGIRAILVDGAQAGRNALDIARDLAARFDGLERSEMERLARTETAFAATQGQVDEAQAEGVEELEVLVSALACPICQEHAGAIVRVDDALPGENLPPFHPNCLDAAAPVAPALR